MTQKQNSMSLEALNPHVTTRYQSGNTRPLPHIRNAVPPNAVVEKIANSLDPEWREQRNRELAFAYQQSAAAGMNPYLQQLQAMDSADTGDVMFVGLDDDRFDADDDGDDENNNNGGGGQDDGFGFDDILDTVFNMGGDDNNNNNNDKNEGTTTKNQKDDKHKIIGSFTGGGSIHRDDDGMILDTFDDIFASIDEQSEAKTNDQGTKRKLESMLHGEDDGINLDFNDILISGMASMSDTDAQRERMKHLLANATVIDTKAEEAQKAKKKHFAQEKEIDSFMKENNIMSEEELKKVKRQRILGQFAAQK